MTISATLPLPAAAAASAPGLAGEPSALRVLVLARISVRGGASRVEIVKDLATYTQHKLTAAELRATVDAISLRLVEGDLVARTKGRLQLTDSGMSELANVIGRPAPTAPWPAIRDGHLVTAALGLGEQSAPRLRALLRPDGLRAAVLIKTFDLGPRTRPTPAALRSALAVVALGRAFGNKVRGGVGSGRDFPTKAGRLLAAQLLQRPRDPGTDSRLVASLAAEAVGSIQSDADSLRTAILRRWLGASIDATAPAPRPAAAPPRPTAAVATALKRAAVHPAAARRPDLPGFAAAVQTAARPGAEGWPGNRKTLISKAWKELAAAHPEWGLTEIEFKSMLAEAHRTGHLALTSADLKDRSNLKELQNSAVAYKNTVWHLVRVDE